MKNKLKLLIFKFYIYYSLNFPINKGKYRLGYLLEKFLGRGIYNINNLLFELSAVSTNEQKFIREINHQGYDFVMENAQKFLTNGGILIDIGANIGWVSVTIAQYLKTNKLTGKIYSFEPSPREFKRLIKNVNLNQFDNIICINKGISAVAESATLNLAELSNPGMNSRYQIRNKTTPVTVNFAPLKEEIQAQDIEQIRCIKIDVEGDEMSVLEGLKDLIPHLKNTSFIVEVTPNYLQKAGKTPEDIYSFFAEFNYLPLLGLQSNLSQWDEVFINE